MTPRFVIVCLLLSSSAFAQADLLFGNGKPAIWREEELDRRFLKSKVNRALTQGTQDPRCAQLLGGLLTVLAEIAPRLHKRDDNFYLDPALVTALNTQMNSQRFPGTAFLQSMVRRVMIDRQMPRAWLDMAPSLNARMTIDVGKLRYLADGVQPIDSFIFTLPVLRERYDIEVTRATTAAADTALTAFRDNYLLRDVAWGGLILIDAGPERKLSKKKAPQNEEPTGLVAQLIYQELPEEPTNPLMRQIPGFRQKAPPKVKISARLAEQQYLDLSKLPKGARLLVRGRLWEMRPGAKELELRDALLFEDRDWSKGASLVDPASVHGCPFAVNELTGLAPQQPGGFAH
ncbi:MAG: hypothetical protein ACT4TC_22575 [Myxococcaceae bacterium]